MGLLGLAFLADGLWLRYKVIEGRCPGCGYDLTGILAKRRCPECGKAFLHEGDAMRIVYKRSVRELVVGAVLLLAVLAVILLITSGR